MPLRTTAAVFLVILIGYGAVAAWPILSGPSLSIESPTELAALSDGRLAIEGVAHRTETLWLNGAPLLMNESGRFGTILTLPSGGSVLSLTATDRFGREITVRRNVFVN